jgi:hypothetical protein
MDWKYKHFNQQAIFSAAPAEVLAAARATLDQALGPTADSADGFRAQGYSGWHNLTAHVRAEAVPEGTKMYVELLAERLNIWGYMLFDVGWYYNGQIDKWFSGVAERLAAQADQPMVSKTTSGVRVQRACLSGCLIYVIVGACLAAIAIPLDRAVFAVPADSPVGPFGGVASLLGLVAGVLAFLYVRNPDAPAARALRGRLGGGRQEPRG